MKHLAMNSFSLWRALLDRTFFNVFLRLVPRRPGLENLRILSRLRLIFSFLAFIREANNSVVEERIAGLNAGFGANAFKGKMKEERKRWVKIEKFSMENPRSKETPYGKSFFVAITSREQTHISIRHQGNEGHNHKEKSLKHDWFRLTKRWWAIDVGNRFDDRDLKRDDGSPPGRTMGVPYYSLSVWWPVATEASEVMERQPNVFWLTFARWWGIGGTAGATWSFFALWLDLQTLVAVLKRNQVDSWHRSSRTIWLPYFRIFSFRFFFFVVVDDCDGGPPMITQDKKRQDCTRNTLFVVSFLD